MKSICLLFLIGAVLNEAPLAIASSSSAAASAASSSSIAPLPSLHKKRKSFSSSWLPSSPSHPLPNPSTLRGGSDSSDLAISKPPSSKLSNFLQRLTPALLMLLSTYLLLLKTGTNGLICLVLLLQTAMYNETTSIIEDYHYKIQNEPRPFKLEEVLEKWWWFLTVWSGSSLRNVVLGGVLKGRMMEVEEKTLDLITYGMTAVGLLVAVVGMASHVSAGPELFRSYLGKVAASHFALFFLVGQSSFWIKTVLEYGILWVLYPALLVIINDTMAYVFGVLMGKHKLLPRLSPKKTVEGFVGAGLSTFASSIPLLQFMSNFGDGGVGIENLKQHALVMALFTSIVAPFGGFLASAVKRAHGAKDFGTLIPGHGGVVDRFDCQVVTAPFVYLYLKQFL